MKRLIYGVICAILLQHLPVDAVGGVYNEPCHAAMQYVSAFLQKHQKKCIGIAILAGVGLYAYLLQEHEGALVPTDAPKYNEGETLQEKQMRQEREQVLERARQRYQEQQRQEEQRRNEKEEQQRKKEQKLEAFDHQIQIADEAHNQFE